MRKSDISVADTRFSFLKLSLLNTYIQLLPILLLPSDRFRCMPNATASTDSVDVSLFRGMG